MGVRMPPRFHTLNEDTGVSGLLFGSMNGSLNGNCGLMRVTERTCSGSLYIESLKCLYYILYEAACSVLVAHSPFRGYP